MKKRLALFMAALLLVQQLLSAGSISAAMACGRNDMNENTTADSSFSMGGKLAAADFSLINNENKVTASLTGDPTHGDLPVITPPAGDPTHGDLPSTNDKSYQDTPANTTTTTTVEETVFMPSLSASKYPSKPKAVDTGYANNEAAFIDWNTNIRTWWFKCDFTAGKPDYIVYQVSMLPFSGTSKDLYTVPGLLKQDAYTLNDKGEFCINFDSLLPRKEVIAKNYNNTDMAGIVSQNISAPQKASSQQLKSINNFKINTQKLLPNLKKQNTEKIKNIINKNSIIIKRTMPTIDKNVKTLGLEAGSFQQTSDETVLSERELLESSINPTTMHKFYIRFFAVNGDKKPVGYPSNTVTLYYGEPSYKGIPTILPERVSGDSNSAYSQSANTMYTGWSAKARSSCYVKFYSGEIPNDNYEYTYYQVIKSTSEPLVDSCNIRNPKGLVATYKSFTPSMNINVLEFVPQMTVKEHWTAEYYVRAVHVYADYDDPCFAQIAVSPAVHFIYGDKPSNIVKASPSPYNDKDLVVDISTPNIRFVKYTAPYFGDNPSDHIVVVKKPSGAFNWLNVNDKKRLRELKEWLEIKKSKEPLLAQLYDAFGSLFSILVDFVNSISSTWTKIQQSAIGCLSKVGIPESIGGFLVNAALAAAGIPPTLPNFDDLSNMGVAYLGQTLVEQSGGYIPKDVADKAVKELVSQAKSAADQAITDLPDGLDDLEGCIKQDPDYVWKAATITVELYNPYENAIPLGEFNLNMAAGISEDSKKFFKTQRIEYPSLKAGQKMQMTIPLDEAINHWTKDGEKKFYDGSPYSKYNTQWDSITSKGQETVFASVSSPTPCIPDNLVQWAKEIGFKTENGQNIKFNIINNVLEFKQGMKIGQNWSASNDKFSSVIYVSPYGADGAPGSIRKPVRTLAKAISMAANGSIIYLNPGSYRADGLKIAKSYISIIGLDSGVSLVSDPRYKYALEFGESTYGTLVKNMTVYGGIREAGQVENVVIGRAYGAGLDGCNKIYNCDISKTGSTDASKCGIIFPTEVVNCKIHDIPAEGIIMAFDKADPSDYLKAMGSCLIKNCEIYNCKTGIYFTGIMSNVEDCNIYKCEKGVILCGRGNQIKNCYIHNMSKFGVGYYKCYSSGITNCTLADTTIPLYFIADKDKPSFSEYNDDYVPYWFAQKCILTQNFLGSNTNNEEGLMVYVENNENGCGLITDNRPFMIDNIYHYEYGEVNFKDCRSGYGKDNMRYNGELSGWQSYAGDGIFDHNSAELEPMLDARGHSSLPECKGIGVQ